MFSNKLAGISPASLPVAPPNEPEAATGIEAVY
jgi:hypothetical protein